MSDIWIKTSNTGTTRWRKATSIHIKRFSGATTKWFAAKVVWIKNTSQGWLRVWPTSGVFPITNPYITTTASGSTPLYGNNTVGANDVIRIGTTYYGRNGTWDANGFSISSYNYLWPYYSTSVAADSYDQLGNLGSGVFSSPSNALTISTFANAAAADGKYISFRITANASNVLYSNTSDSKDSYGKIQVIRRTPINTTFAINGTASVGSTLSISSAWNITEAYKPDAARSTIYWYKSSSNTSIYNGQGRTQITSANGSYSYVVQQADLGSYIIAEETAFNTGSDYDIGVGLFTNGLNQVTAVSAIVADTTPQAFNTISYVKNFPSSGSGGVVRTTTLSWNASTNATRYEIEYEGSYNNSTWTTVQSFAASPYTSSTSQSVSWGSPIPAGGFDYYTYMRARVRASNTTSATQVIGDGGSYIYASGVAPGQPTFGAITYNSAGTTASVTASVGTTGSNYLYSPPFEYQYRAYNGSYPGTWTSSSSPISLTGLTASTTYYIKIRTRNYDELVSTENETNFPTPAAQVAPTGGSASISGASTVGSLLTLTKTDATGSPNPTPTWLWRIADGGFGGNTFNGGTIVQNGGLTYTSQYSGYAVRVEITWSNAVAPAQSVITNSIAVVAAGVAPSGGGVTLSPSGTQQAGTTITANVSAMSGTATITYATQIRKATGYSPTSNTDGTLVASGSGTGNVASHTITTSEASGTPDQFRAFTTGTNSFGNNTVSSNTVISTPAVVVVAPAITSGPSISWASGNNFTLSATASNATNLEFQVEFANNSGGPALSTQTFFFGASSGGGTTGSQSYSWARTRVRANNSSTGLSSSFSGYTGWA